MNQRKAAQIAVIGCGAVFEAFYLDALKSLQKSGIINVALLVDSNERYASGYLKAFPQADVATSLDAGLSRTGIERAIVLTPPSSHAMIMEKLAESGIHVYCEKPLTVSPQEAMDVSRMFEERGLLCNVGFVRRSFPNFRAFKQMFSSLGDSRTITITDGEVFRWPIKTAGIFQPKEVGGGVVWDKLSHNLDLIQWIDGLKSVDEVSSSCKPGGVPNDILVKGTTNSATFTVAVSWTAGLPNLVTARDANYFVESKNGLVKSLKSSLPATLHPQVSCDVSSYNEAVLASLTAFFELLSADQSTVLATAKESIVLTEFLELIDQKARGGSQ